MEENMDKLLNYIDDLCEENGKLHDKLREAENAGRIKNTKTFLKGLGAGVAITPGAFWLAWRLVELLIRAADWIAVPPVFLAVLAICIVGGTTLYLHSEAILKGTDKLLDTLLDDDGLDEDMDFFEFGCERRGR